MYKLQEIEQEEIQRVVALCEQVFPEFKAGDTIKISILIKEGNNERIQSFQGICIGKKSRGINSSFDVRRAVGQESIVRVFPLYSPIIKKIEVINKGKVRQAKLYYMLNLYGKKSRVKSK